MSLESLPPELMIELGRELDSDDLKTIRLVNKGLMYLVNHSLFKTITVDSRLQGTDSVLSFLRSAVQPDGLISEYSRSIEFTSIEGSLPSPPEEPNEEKELEIDSQSPQTDFHRDLQALIRPAILGLTNATSIRIECRKDPAWIRESIFDAAFQLPRLSEISYDHYSLTPISWPSTPHAEVLTRLALGAHWTLMTDSWMKELGTFVSRFPQLEALSISTLYPPSTEAPGCSFSELILAVQDSPIQPRKLTFDYFIPILQDHNVGFLQSLNSLILLDVPECFVGIQADEAEDPTLIDTFWTALSTHDVCLKKIIIDGITTSFFEYLSSYSGLEHLELRDRPLAYISTAGGDFIDTVIGQVLPKHEKSLCHFGVDTDDQDLWSFNPTWASAFSQCEALRSLTVCMDYSPHFVDRFCTSINRLIDCALPLKSLHKVTVKIVYNNDDYLPPNDELPDFDDPFILGYHSEWAEERFTAAVEHLEVGSPEPRAPLKLYLADFDDDPWVLTKRESDKWCFVTVSSKSGD